MREMNGGGRKTAVDGNLKRCAHRIIKDRAQGSEFSGDALGYKIGGGGLHQSMDGEIRVVIVAV